MPYKIRITGDAEHDVRNLPGNVRQRARRVIKSLADDPRPAGARELRGRPGYYRLWLDRWRVIYRIYDDDQVVLVLRVRRKTGPETYHEMRGELEPW